MIKLSSPGHDVNVSVAEILCEAKSARPSVVGRSIVRKKKYIRDRIQEYVNYNGNGKQLKPSALRGVVATRLKGRWSSGTKKAKAIQSHLVCSAHCPYCGQRMQRKGNDRTNDRDHVLPRSLFPEFALLRCNLVIVCDACNQSKGSSVLDANGEWLFVHPYFDAHLKRRLLRASVDLSSGVPIVSWSWARGTPQRLKRHFERLDLERRYIHGPHEQAHKLLKNTKLSATHTALTKAKIAAARYALCETSSADLALRPNDPTALIVDAMGRSQTLAAYLNT